LSTEDFGRVDAPNRITGQKIGLNDTTISLLLYISHALSRSLRSSPLPLSLSAYHSHLVCSILFPLSVSCSPNNGYSLHSRCTWNMCSSHFCLSAPNSIRLDVKHFERPIVFRRPAGLFIVHVLECELSEQLGLMYMCFY
jgi:hypothetical protein